MIDSFEYLHLLVSMHCPVFHFWTRSQLLEQSCWHTHSTWQHEDRTYDTKTSDTLCFAAIQRPSGWKDVQNLHFCACLPQCTHIELEEIELELKSIEITGASAIKKQLSFDAFSPSFSPARSLSHDLVQIIVCSRIILSR